MAVHMTDISSVANLAILLLNFATFQTNLAILSSKSTNNKFSHFWQLFISDSNYKKGQKIKDAF